MEVLINELAGYPGDDEALLVLDDYHLIGSQDVHLSLEFLLEHLPPSVHLVLATRADPPLPLARLRARGRLTELRTAELRFTADEAAALLSAVTGAGLPAGSVAALTARTEGWAAGLQLAGLSLRGQPDAAGFVAAFSGSHRYVLDYLAEEVLDGQPERVREFLLETSVLGRLSGELCDVVTGRADSQALLQQIEAAGLFLTPLDEVRGWWRYHHLFADLLRARLQQEHPGKAAALHRNAAAWCAEHGLAGDAVRHALSAGDPVGSARLIERHFDEIFLHGESATIQRWLAALPAELARSRLRRWRGRGWRSSAAIWKRPGRRWILPGARPPMLPMSRSSLPSAGRQACWRTFQRRSRSDVPISPCSTAMPRRRPRPFHKPLPHSARESGCCTRSACGCSR